MIICYEPRISDIQYLEFAKMCVGLPATHGQWEYEREKNLSDLRFSGHKIEYVPIEPSELRKYCQAHQCQADIKALENLAYEKGGKT